LPSADSRNLLRIVGDVLREPMFALLLGAGAVVFMAHDRAHRFFSSARWSPDQLGLVLARLAVEESGFGNPVGKYQKNRFCTTPAAKRASLSFVP
jgi:DNA helicase HerA-like ATPase